MKGRQKLEALVLSSRKIGEADRLVTLFSRDHGLSKVIAKGVRRVPSQRGGHLEPFTQVLAIVTMTRAGNFVGAVETLDHFPRLHERTQALTVCRIATLTLQALFAEEQVEPELYDALLHAWQIAPELSLPQLGMLELALMMLALRRAGLVPDLSVCRVCNSKQPQASILLDASSGGWKCLTCHHGFSGTNLSLPPALLKVLRFVYVYPGRALNVQLDEVHARQLVVSMRDYVAQVTDSSLLRQHVLQTEQNI